MKIFLSSTYLDLTEIRQIAISYLEEIMGQVTKATGEIVAMEFFNATENACKSDCLSNLDKCNLVVGIYGEKYGTIDQETGLSMSELEFDYAIKKDIPILAFVMHTNHREKREQEFIDNKVFMRGITCAIFSNNHDFLTRLDSSLKEYFNTYEGYSVNSLWNEVNCLYDKIYDCITNGAAGYDLLISPYIPGDEKIAFETIFHCAQLFRDSILNLNIENSVLHPYAYKYQLDNNELSPPEVQSLQQDIQKNSNIILQNWETINIGFRNHATHIMLAAAFLKLCWMQHRLLTEPWTENLRQEVIQVRNIYVETIDGSKYVD